MTFLNTPRRIRTTYVSDPADGLSRSMAERRRASQDRQAERQAFAEDPVVIATRRVRAAGCAVSEAEAKALVAWEAANNPVSPPFGHLIHPQKHEAILAFVKSQGWSDDWLSPVTPTESLEDTKRRFARDAQAELDDATVALQAVERGEGH